MLRVSGKFVIIGLGTEDVKYLWNGKLLEGILGIFIYRNTKISLKVTDKSILPCNEMLEYGIKIKEKR